MGTTTRIADDEVIGLYRMMFLIRRFEERCGEMYARGKITGFTHLYIGEEAVAVGAISVLHERDYVVSTYRDHGHCLAKGTDPKLVMAELFGRSTGLSKGKGGSMHLYDDRLRFLGGYAIVAGGLPIAAGVGMAIKYKEENCVVATFFGDGATNAGAFHESLNVAAAWKLPIIFICENNFFAIGTALERVAPSKELYKRVKAYALPSERVDGMDVLAVREAMERAVERAREGEGPSFIEAVTYRYRGHSMADPDDYRTKREEKIWKERDPIIKMAQHLRDKAIISPDDLKELQNEVNAQVDASLQFAEESPWPELQELMKDIYPDY
jgi:pyruvate dehydrogenase E1 component alpha subunit